MQTNKFIQFGASLLNSVEQKWENKMHLIEWMDGCCVNEYILTSARTVT